MNKIVIIAIVFAGFAFLIVLYKLLKKGAKVANKLPTNFLMFFLIYGIIGLTGFLMYKQTTDSPLLLAFLLMLVSLTGGLLLTNNLYEKWEWSIAAGFGKKLLYLTGITLTGMITFVGIFLLSEHRGFPKKEALGNDLVWWYALLILTILLPLFVKHLHLLWNDIPKISQVIPVFNLPVGTAPPFIETGGLTLNFVMVIPLEYHSKNVAQSRIALPLNKTLSDAFHHKLHEHNIVKRSPKKIVYAEENKRAKVYGWAFYRMKKIWWGWWVKKYYLKPDTKVGLQVSNGETIFVERIKIWEQ